MPPKPEKSNDELVTACMIQLRELFESEMAKHQIIPNPPSPPPPPQNLPKIPKPRLAQFDGSNPLDWLFQAEQFFELTQTASPQRMKFIPFYMQGPALAWFKWMHNNHQLETWENFTHALERRFGPSSYANHQVAL